MALSEAHPERVLVVYNLFQPRRSTIDDHLYSFRRHGRARYYYLNMGVRDVPAWVASTPFDAVIFHTSFLSQRWSPELFIRQLERAEPLRGLGVSRVALPQDEFLRSDMVSEFVNEFEVDHLFSVAPESEWNKIYPGVDRSRTRIHLALTGYLSDDTVRRIDRIVARTPERPIDIGYRAWQGAFWLGRHGMLKRWVADRVVAQAPAGLALDISTDNSRTFHGDDWFRFLARCKYTIGVEGGATVLDRDGSIKERTDAYLAEHPDAGFEQVEAACFPDEDGKLALLAVSPRHLEACATRTCQVLVEGDYSGVLRPGEHYIALRRDLSNLDEVLEMVRRDELRAGITQAAYRDVVASGRFSYARFVGEVEAAMAEASGVPVAPRTSFRPGHLRARAADRASWLRIAFTLRTAPRLARIANALLPDPALRFARRIAHGRGGGSDDGAD